MRALTMMIILMTAAWCVIALHAQSAISDNRRVRNITVVDAKGTERVWNERGRFVTSDPGGGVFIGLDTEQARPTLSLDDKSKTVFEQPAAIR